MRPRRGSWLVVVAVLLVQVVPCAAARLVLISLDGLYPEIYREADRLGVQVPNLRQLARRGTSADGMLGIFPSSTYPSHTTLITGTLPARHGVVANSTFAPEKAEPAWYWFASDVRVPTLPEAAHAAGLTVGVSCWPALVDAPYVQWHLPEIWSLGRDDASSRQKVLQHATPGLVAEVEARFGAWTDERFEWGKQDDRITDGAVTLLATRRPHLLLMHLVEVDHVLHEHGRNAPEALRAFEAADRQIGRILQALADSGVADSTNVVVAGDHGFANVHTEVRPNAELVRLGLLHEGAAARGEWGILARTTTAAAAFYARRSASLEDRARAQRHFEKLARERCAGVFAVLDRAALDRYGAFPDAVFGLVCLPGYTFSSRDTGDLLAAARSRGMHGYRPEEPSMHAGFVAAGPDFATGIAVPLVRMLDVAPTLARVLGVDLGPQVEGIAVPGLLAPPGR